MLGGFTIRRDNATINDGNNRSRKVWLLLAYMIYCRNRCISQEELVQLLWGDSENSVNPVNALKTMFHRVRSMLDQLGDSCGRTFIIRTGGTYAWNPDVVFSYDADEFEALCKAGAAAEEKSVQLETYLKALELYQGNFLPKLASEPWVIPVSAYFHNLFMQTVRQTLPLLEESGDLREAISLCRKTVGLDPYDEEIYRHLMKDLLLSGDQQSVIKVYEDMSDLLFSNFGIMPSDDTKALYRKAVQTTNSRAINLDVVQDQLREPDSGVGAMFCDYDFFKVIYHAEARAVARSGNAVHIGLLTASGETSRLSKRSLDICMANLRLLIASNLRKGDIFSRCSVSQYIIMLPMANYEDSRMVMERIIRAFARQYPHSPAQLHYSVQPLEPNA